MRKRLADLGGSQFLVLCAHTLLFQAVTFLLRPTASYRAIELDVSTVWLGMLAASFALVPLLVALPAGNAADRFGERRVLLFGASIVGLSAVLFVVLSDTFGGVLVATAVLGTGHLLCTVAQQAMVANLIPNGRFDSAYGYYAFFGSLGQVAGPGILSLFGAAEALPNTGDAFVAALVIAGALVLVTMLARATPRRGQARTAERKVRALIRKPGLAKALVISSIVLCSMDITLVYLPALGAENGLSVGVVSMLLGIMAIASMASRLFLGRLVDVLGRRVFVIVSTSVSGIAIAVLGFSLPVPVLALAMVAAGFGLGVCQPLTLSWLAEISGPGLRGRIMSLRLVVNRFGQVVLPSGAGMVASGLGSAGVLWLTATALGAAATIARSVPMDGHGSE